MICKNHRTPPPHDPARSLGSQSSESVSIPGSHRAYSAPPRISTTNARDQRTETGEELGDGSRSCGLDSSVEWEESDRCYHFLHADFKVIARGISVDEASELRRILATFASTLGPERPFVACSKNNCRHHSHDGIQGESSRHALDDSSDVSGAVAARSTQCVPKGGSSLRHRRRPSHTTATNSEVYGQHRKRVDDKHWPMIVTESEPVASYTRSASDSFGRREASHVEESGCDSSIDFLHFARRKSPDTVRKLEHRYDGMMEQLALKDV